MIKKIKFNMFIIVVLFCFVTSLFLINIIGKKVLPVFMDYAISEMTNISTKIINSTISNHLKNIDNFDELVLITKSSGEDIQMIDFNSKIVNEILNSTTNIVLENLKSLEEGNSQIFNNMNIRKYNNGIIYEVPIGVAFNNILLGNLGPKIPVKLNIVGDVLSNVKTNIKEYGINNALIEISINVTIKEKVIIPFISETVSVTSSIPISLKVIQGKIPTYYGSGISKGSSILSIPTE